MKKVVFWWPKAKVKCVATNMVIWSPIKMLDYSPFTAVALLYDIDVGNLFDL